MTDHAFVYDTALNQNPDFFQSENADAMTNLFETCQRFRLFGMIVGISGLRKSATGQMYGRTHGAYYHRISKSAAKLQPGLFQIALATNAGIPSTGARDIFAAIRDRLCGSDRLLIIDEAQHMEDDLIEAVRDLWDETGIGVVMIGNLSLKDRIEDGKNSHKFAQLIGRIGPRLILKTLPDGEVEAMCAHFGVEGKQAVAVVRKAARAPGGLHNAASLLRIAREISGGDTINLDQIIEAAVLTGGTI